MFVFREDQDDSHKAETPSAEVDEEGYSVRPQATWDSNEKTRFYSDSDTDSEDEKEKRFHVEIKPLNNGTTPLSASADELRSTMENFTLSPLGMISVSIQETAVIEYNFYIINTICVIFSPENRLLMQIAK